MRKFIWGLSLFLILYSCKKNDHQLELLKQAQDIVEKDPSLAISLLDSIHNPERMDKDYYMQYIVAKTQAKFKTYQDISKDTLILEAQRYFEKTRNYAQAVLANYYAGCYYYENDNPDRELEYSKLSEYYARKTGNNLYIGKSLYSKGNIYHDKEMDDSAKINFRQSISYYQKCLDQQSYLLESIRMTGNLFYINDNLDSAYFYYDKGIRLAKEFNNEIYKVTFTHMLGNVYRKNGDYDKASPLLNKALLETLNQEEKNRIYMNLLKLYNSRNLLDSSAYISNILKQNIGDIGYIYTLQDIYKSISEYCQKAGNYEEALYYNNLLLEVNQKINDSKRLRTLAEIEHKYISEIQKKETDSLRMRNYITWICGIALIALIVVVAYYRHRNMRQVLQQKRLRQIEKNKMIGEKLKIQNLLVKQQDETMTYLQGVYWNLVNEWGEIEKKVKSIAKEYGAKEEPELYVRIKQLMGSFKENTNDQFIRQAKEHLRKKTYGEKALELLEDKDLLLFMLYYCGYKRKEVARLLDVNPKKENMIFRKLGLRNKLIEAGMPKEEIEKMLFAEDADFKY